MLSFWFRLVVLCFLSKVVYFAFSTFVTLKSIMICLDCVCCIQMRWTDSCKWILKEHECGDLALSNPTVNVNVRRCVLINGFNKIKMTANISFYKCDSHPCAPDQFSQISLGMYSFIFTYQCRCTLKTKTFRQSNILYQFFCWSWIKWLLSFAKFA